jgi:hypothetical protein
MVDSTQLITADIQKQFVEEDEYVMVCERVSKLPVFGSQQK